MPLPPPGQGRRWIYLAAGLLAQTSSSIFQFGMPFLIPQLQDIVGGSLVKAAVLAACPNLGLMLTLIAWGWVADRYGERLTISLGLTLGGLLLVCALVVTGPVALALVLVLAGAASASVNAASGRMIMGWFAANERGLAMGIRQTAQPLGVALAAAALPWLGDLLGLHGTLAVAGALCAVAGLAVYPVIANPPAQAASRSAPTRRAQTPYREPRIWRLHGASALLTVPQFTVSAFAFVYLVEAAGMSPITAGAYLSATQLVGAAGRVAVGRWSDVVSSRMLPLRILSFAGALSLLLFALSATAASPFAVACLLAASLTTSVNNGLTFTAVAETAGSSWSGRALGAQNTVQNAVASVTPGAVAALIVVTGYAGGFALAAIFPLAAVLVAPRRDAAITPSTPPRQAANIPSSPTAV